MKLNLINFEKTLLLQVDLHPSEIKGIDPLFFPDFEKAKFFRKNH